MEMEEMIAAFMDVTMCDNHDAAARHLASCNGHLNDAVCNYFADAAMPEVEEEVRPLIPAYRERLYDNGHRTAARSSAPCAVRYEPPPPPPPPAPVPYAVAATGWGDDIGEDSTPTEEVAGADDTLMEEDDGPAEGEEVCRVRVRFPGGAQVLIKEFGANRPVAALFRYCHSVVTEGGAVGRPFRLVRPAGGASGEIRRRDATFEELGLNRCTVHLVF